jgi:hypothetical protein
VCVADGSKSLHHQLLTLVAERYEFLTPVGKRQKDLCSGESSDLKAEPSAWTMVPMSTISKLKNFQLKFMDLTSSLHCVIWLDTFKYV